ncbi:MAG: ribonuclease P protein component [Oscillospiraceae bacterium]
MKSSVTLKKNYEFRRMYKKSASAVGAELVLYCRRNHLGHNRLGITVSTKLGHAVVRNRVRRRLREIVRLNSDKITQGWDLVLVARGRAVRAEYGEIDGCFLRLCGKLKLLRP